MFLIQWHSSKIKPSTQKKANVEFPCTQLNTNSKLTQHQIHILGKMKWKHVFYVNLNVEIELQTPICEWRIYFLFYSTKWLMKLNYRIAPGLNRFVEFSAQKFYSRIVWKIYRFDFFLSVPGMFHTFDGFWAKQ